MIGNVLAIAKGGAGIVRDGGQDRIRPRGHRRGNGGIRRRRPAAIGLAGASCCGCCEASPQRVEPPCPHYGECGGCNLQHMSYDEQLRSKTGNTAGQPEEDRRPGRARSRRTILASPPWRYRSKSEFQVRDGAAGFFRKESHRVVAIRRLPLAARGRGGFFPRPAPGLAGCGQRPAAGHQQRPGARRPPGDRRRRGKPGSAASGRSVSRSRAVRLPLRPGSISSRPTSSSCSPCWTCWKKPWTTRRARRPSTSSAAAAFSPCRWPPAAARCWPWRTTRDNVAALRANLELNRIGQCPRRPGRRPARRLPRGRAVRRRSPPRRAVGAAHRRPGREAAPKPSFIFPAIRPPSPATCACSSGRASSRMN